VCQGIFCLDHRTFEAHNCKNAVYTDRRAMVCPLCNEPIVALPNQDPNRVLDDHITQGCATKKPTGYKCNVKGCKKVDVVPFVCSKCRLHHCVRHRFEDDHSCPRKPQKPKPSKQPTTTATNVNNVNNVNNASTNNNTNNNNNYNNYNNGAHANSRPQATTRSANAGYPGNTGANSHSTYQPNNSEATIGIRLTNGDVLRRSFSCTNTLRDVQIFIDQNRTDGFAPYIMRTTFPPKEFSFSDLDSTLAHLGLVPSGMIILHNFVDETARSNAPLGASSSNSTQSGNDASWWGTISSFVGSFLPSSTQ